MVLQKVKHPSKAIHPSNLKKRSSLRLLRVFAAWRLTLHVLCSTGKYVVPRILHCTGQTVWKNSWQKMTTEQLLRRASFYRTENMANIRLRFWYLSTVIPCHKPASSYSRHLKTEIHPFKYISLRLMQNGQPTEPPNYITDLFVSDRLGSVWSHCKRCNHVAGPGVQACVCDPNCLCTLLDQVSKLVHTVLKVT